MVRLDTSVTVSGNEQDFILAAVKESERLDGRSPTQLRRLHIEFQGKEKTGRCEVSIGKTRVLTSVSCRAVEPTQFRPKDGFLDFNIVLSPMADPKFVMARSRSVETEQIRRLLERVLKGSKAVDVESLCILPGKKVWSIRVEVTVIDNDGNVLDACCVATLAALLHFRRPEVTIRGDEITIHSASERESVPLNIQHVPILVTFAILPDTIHGELNPERILIDPTLAESTVATGEVSVAVNTQNQVCIVHKVGGAALLPEDIKRCIKTAMRKVDYIVGRVTSCIAEDAVRRRKEGLDRFKWVKDRKSVGELEKIAEGVQQAIKEVEKQPDAGTRRRARSLSPDDPDIQEDGSRPVKKPKRPVKVSLTSKSKLTLTIPDKKPDEPTEEVEEVEEIEEIEEVEEVEEEEEDAEKL